MTTDLVFTKTNGSYDFTVAANGDLENADFFDTAILYSLFGEKRASSSEMVVAQYRRGWIGNTGQNYENGSKIWLYEQARLTRSAMNGIKDAAIESLQWLINDGYLKNLEASVSLINGIVQIEVVLYRFNAKPDSRFYDLWENTGIR